VLKLNDEEVLFKNYLNTDGTYPQLETSNVFQEEEQWLRDLSHQPTKTYKLKQV
jgi:hypothetical protein